MFYRTNRTLSALSDRLNLGTRSLALVAGANMSSQTLRDGLRRIFPRQGSIPHQAHASSCAAAWKKPSSPPVPTLMAVAVAGVPVPAASAAWAG